MNGGIIQRGVAVVSKPWQVLHSLFTSFSDLPRCTEFCKLYKHSNSQMQQYKYTGRNTLVEIHKGKYTNTNHDRCCIYCFIISLSFSVTSVAKLQIANYDDHCRYPCHFLCSKKAYFRASMQRNISVLATNASEIQPLCFCKILQCI